MMNMRSIMAAYAKYEIQKEKLEQEKQLIAKSYETMFKLCARPQPKRLPHSLKKN